MPDTSPIPSFNPDSTTNNPNSGNNLPENLGSPIQITHQFPEQKITKSPDSAEKEEVKDIFEEGLKFEPPAPVASPENQPIPETQVQAPEETSPPLEAANPAPTFNSIGSAYSTQDSISAPTESSAALNDVDALQLKDLNLKEETTNQELAQAPAPRKKSLLGLITGILVVIVIFGAGGYAYFTYFAKKNLTISLNVTDATIKIDNQDYSSKLRNQTLEVSLSGDSHKFAVSKEDYFTYNKTIDVARIPGSKLKINLRTYPEPLQLMKYPVDYLVADFVKNKLFYRSNSDKIIYSITLDENGAQKDFQALSPEIFTSKTNLLWSPDFAAVLAWDLSKDCSESTPAPSKCGPTSNAMLFRLSDQGQIALPNINTAAYSLDGKKIYYTQNNLLMQVNSDEPTKDPEQILDLAGAKLENPKIIASPETKYLVLIPQNQDMSKNFIYLFDLEKKELTELVKTGNQISGVFSPDNIRFLYATSAKTSEIPKLSFVDIKTKELKSLNIQTEIKNLAWLDNDRILYSQYNESSKSYALASYNLGTGETLDYQFKSVKALEMTDLQYNSENEQIYFLNQGLIYHFKLDDGKY